MEKRATILDIAEQLGVTPGTVSRALNNHPKISAETKQAVIQMAEKLNYRANRIASSLRSGKSHVIGVMIPSAEINFFGSVVHGIESIANMHGYNVLIFQSNELQDHEVKGIETFVSARVDGILASIAKDTKDYSHYLEVKARGIPLVFFDRANSQLGIPSVVIDDYKGAYIATSHLLEQGYQRVAHISGPQHIKIFNDRQRGYVNALQDKGIAYDASLVYTGDVSIEAGRAAVNYFFQLPIPPDAVFAVEDFTALGVLKALKERHIRIPEDFGVIGFANEMFGLHVTPTLSTIDQQTVLMGREAVSLLLQICNEKDGGTLINKQVVLEPLPNFRESSLRNTVR
ncbi:MAG: LacI family DNA-binding transcriptional regulator [Bacteroidota bacterium]